VLGIIHAMGFIHTMAIPGSKVFWLLLAIVGVVIHACE